MPDGSTAKLPVQPEHRHQVDHGKRFAGHGVEVAEVRLVQPRGVHQIGEQLLMQPVAVPAAVLVELDGDE